MTQAQQRWRDRHVARPALWGILLGMSLWAPFHVSVGHAQVIGNGEPQDLPISLPVAGAPDPFTGAMVFQVPLNIPPGRHGMQPNLQLIYRSSGPDNEAGHGWTVELGSIERNTRLGLNFSSDDFVFRVGGATQELVFTTTGSGYREYRAKIEGPFTRFRKYDAGYWDATDRVGRVSRFGFTDPSQVHSALSPTNVYAWKLDRITDPQGNYLTVSYYKPSPGYITYLSQIQYAVHPSAPTPPITISFHRDNTVSAPGYAYSVDFSFQQTQEKYAGFSERYRTIAIWKGTTPGGSGTTLIRAFALTQGKRSGQNTPNQLQQVQAWGADATVTIGAYPDDPNDGTITPGPTPPGPPLTLTYTATQAPQYDLLTTIQNGLGATTTITYASQATNTPSFTATVAQTLAVNDGNGNVGSTGYTYTNGYFNTTDQTFRGFAYSKTTGPPGPSGEQAITEFWFLQGNGVVQNNVILAQADDPSVTPSRMLGKPYQVKVSDATAKVYTTTTTTTYLGPVQTTQPSFNPPNTVLTSLGPTGARQVKTVYASYDAYGNVTEEDDYGDPTITTDDRTIGRTVFPNTTAWIVGLPASQITYSGIGVVPANRVAETDFYYDDLSSCGSTGSGNQTPTLGNLTRVVRWLNTGTSPEIRRAYDAYGNRTCERDPNGNITTYAYDTVTHTVLTTITSPTPPIPALVTTLAYYGISSGAPSTGQWGQLWTVTDPNAQVVSRAYDALGRLTTVTLPGTLGTYIAVYNFPQPVGSQYIKVVDPASLETRTYLDGLGRTIYDKTTGPNSQVVVTQTTYDARGQLRQRGLPSFFATFDTPVTAPPGWTIVSYDPVARVTEVDLPDNTGQVERRTLACYDDDAGVAVTLDPNKHRRRETRDVLGRLAKVEEYSTAWPPGSLCDPSAGTVYATTAMPTMCWII